MKIFRPLLITLILACVAGFTMPAAADEINSNAGTSAFPFLKINVGARAVSMGGAFTGLADDESALYYNPAGITSFEENRFIFGYHDYFADMQSGFVGLVKNLGYTRTIGASISYLNYGDFIETDQFGTTTGTFSGGSLVAAFTFAMKHGYYLSFGGTGKIVYEKVQDFSATGVALDLGAKYTADRNRYSIGFMVQNLGAQLSSLGEDTDKLPLTFRTGFAYNPRGLPLTIASDLIIPTDNDAIFALGGEYYELKPVYIRMCWNSVCSNFRTADSDDSWAGLSVGLGFEFSRKQISYSFSPGADLGDSHRITLTGGF